VRESLGGAGNVAANVVGLGARCILMGTAGDESGREHLEGLAGRNSIEASFVSTARQTTTKVRVIADHQQLVRVDLEETAPVHEKYSLRLARLCVAALSRVQLLLISDYGKGTCTTTLCGQVIAAARSHGVAILVDPKTPDWERYRGATLVTPNLAEFREVVGVRTPNDDAPIVECARGLLDRFDLGGLAITRSERGITLVERTGFAHFRTEARHVFDVTGAGDTVIATLACSLATGVPLSRGVQLANRAAGVVVTRVGCAPIRIEDLRETTVDVDADVPRRWSRAELLQRLERDRASGCTIVLTNGCFDLLHRGHLSYLRHAKSLGDRLVVAINSDRSVRRLKGPTRPINGEDDRALLLASLAFVDYVYVFDEDTPVDIVAAVRPDVLVKGADYAPGEVAGREHAGRLVLLDHVDGYSSTSIIERVRGRRSY
jgi:D-beta-D-heptose 7-phosphate kinase/D-beta-D-heptose 1-phosphate adenosyltransferase